MLNRRVAGVKGNKIPPTGSLRVDDSCFSELETVFYKELPYYEYENSENE